jgi:hypothetical protein
MEQKKIFTAMMAVMRDIEAIVKDKVNTTQGFKFRGIDDVYNAVHPLFKKHGIFTTSEVLSSKREDRLSAKGGNLIWSILEIRFTFYAEDGSFVQSTMQGEGMDSGDKGSNKAMAVAQKYAIIQAFSIPTVEGSPEPDKEDSTIYDEILKCTDETSMKDLWISNIQLHKDVKFCNAIRNRKKELGIK